MAALAVQKKNRLPFELVEEQARIFLIRPELKAYADDVREKLEKANLRVRVDAQAGQLKERIHEAIMDTVPYLIVIGPKEVESQKISWRTSDSETEQTMTVDEFVNMVKN